MELLVHGRSALAQGLGHGHHHLRRRMTMNVLINDKPYTLPDGATLPDALAALEAVPPFAVAVNREFVPRSAIRRARAASPTTASK
jgi:sulfur carrier protein